MRQDVRRGDARVKFVALRRHTDLERAGLARVKVGVSKVIGTATIKDCKGSRSGGKRVRILQRKE